MEEVTQHSECMQLGLHVKNADSRSGINGAFNDDYLAGMLEAVDIKKLDIIYSFKGALLHCVCGEVRKCSVTAVFPEYVEIMQFVCGYNK